MFRLVHMLALPLALLWPWAAAAAPRSAATPTSTARTAMVRLDRAFARLLEISGQRRRLLRRHARFQATIRATRRLAAGPARDFKLRRLLAGSRAVAGRLSALDRRRAAALRELHRARNQLLRSIQSLRRAQAALARLALARTAKRAATTPAVLRIARVRLKPLDGPREILEKADLLADSEEKIRKRLEKLDRAIARLAGRQELRRIARRVDRYGNLFGEDTSRRRITRIRPSRPTVSDDGELSAPAGTQSSSGLDAGYAADPGGSDGDLSHGASSSTYAVVLKELLTPSTVAALRKAGTSGDPGARLAALKRAREELRRTMARLRSRADRYRARARNLARQQHRRH